MLNTVDIVEFVGLCEQVWERIPGEIGERGSGDRALEVLKAWCEVRTGRTPGP
jgi:hypothetical protein